ncbi:MAG: hypothetical protein ACRC1D_04930, partial [Culicoidibacterales bacterium]
MNKKLGIFTMITVCSVALLSMNTVKAERTVDQPDLQTWHTSGMTTGSIHESYIKPVVETTPEYVAPPVVETAPEYVAPPV